MRTVHGFLVHKPSVVNVGHTMLMVSLYSRVEEGTTIPLDGDLRHLAPSWRAPSGWEHRATTISKRPGFPIAVIYSRLLSPGDPSCWAFWAPEQPEAECECVIMDRAMVSSHEMEVEDD